jgi:hypothetical protein
MTRRVFLSIVLVLTIAAGSVSLVTAEDIARPPSPGNRWDKISTVHLKIEAEDAKCLLNLDTERIDTPVTDIHPRSEQLQWYEQIGLDLICTTRKTDKGSQTVLEGLNLKTAPCKFADKSKSDPFSDISVDRMFGLLQGAKASSEIPQDAFVFKTDKGRMGVLKITSADKSGITLQYMLEEDPKEAFRRRMVDPPRGRSFPRIPTRPFTTVRRFKAFDAMLKKNGFVVTAEQFPQIFAAYTFEGSDGFRPFITTDSAWETYHVLLEEGIKQIEQYQAVRLKQFSRRLLTLATKLADEGNADFDKIVQYASIALALQDKARAATLTGDQKHLLNALGRGEGTVRGPVGFPLSAAAFRANSFYTSSPLLSDYFAARRWCALVVFPVEDKNATSLAARLAIVIDSDDELRNLCKALSDPYDLLLGPATDGDVASYTSSARKLVGKNATLAQIVDSTDKLQTHLRTALGDPQINDQLLGREQYDNFPKLIKGFRLLPPRRLISSVCFQKSAPRGEGFPSALHFLVACKEMKSPAAVRALKQSKGDAETARTQQIDPGKLPDSLHGRAMKLIASLQKKPPENAPGALKTQAWSDKQLWTQLGAWAQQRHTWALHSKQSYSIFGGEGLGDAGMVSPYPDFFKSLGVLARQTAKTLADNGLGDAVDTQMVSRDILNHIEAFHWSRTLPRVGLTKQQSQRLDTAGPMIQRMYEFRYDCVEERYKLLGFESRPDNSEAIQRLGELARRCLKTKKVSPDELKVLRAFAQSDSQIVSRLGELAGICDQLASIARKQLAGKPLGKKENTLICDYGRVLSRLHFYEGQAYMYPRDDFPIISPIHVNPLAGRTLHAALGRPHAIYVLEKLNNEATLMRGAVLSYREFTHPISEPLDDQAWRRIIQSGRSVPPPPKFTASFIVAPNEDEILEMLSKDQIYSGIDGVPGRRITQALLKKSSNNEKGSPYKLFGHLEARCTIEDLPTLLTLLRACAKRATDDNSAGFITVMHIVADLSCKSVAEELLLMLDHKKPILAHGAAYILSRQPELIDSTQLTIGYDKLPLHQRGLRCILLGGMPKPDTAAIELMTRALNDPHPAIRWHGAVALGRSNAKAPAAIKALTKRISDANPNVAAASVQSLAQLKALPSGQLLLDVLKKFKYNPAIDHPRSPAAKAVEIRGHKQINLLEAGRFLYTPLLERPDSSIIDALIQLKYKQATPVILQKIVAGDFGSGHLGFHALRNLDGSNYGKHLTDMALNDKLDTDLRVEAIDRIPQADHPISACRRLTSLLPDRTKTNSKSTAVRDAVIMTIAEIVFPKDYEEYYGEESGVGLFDMDPPEDEASEKRREKQQQKQLKRLKKLVRGWARSTTQPAGK